MTWLAGPVVILLLGGLGPIYIQGRRIGAVSWQRQDIYRCAYCELVSGYSYNVLIPNMAKSEAAQYPSGGNAEMTRDWGKPHHFPPNIPS